MSKIQKSIHKRVDALEQALLDKPQADVPVVHRFSEGLYIREISMAKGIFAIGHRQRYAQWNIFVSGKVQVLNDDGTTSILTAPMSFEGKAGRKVGFVLEDCVWQNIFPNPDNIQDVDKLENIFFDKSEASLRAAKKRQKVLVDGIVYQDFIAMAKELGVTPEIIYKQSRDESDVIDLPPGSYKFVVSDSSIEGKGIFATGNIEANDMIGPARLNGGRTVLGRFTNHSPLINAEMRPNANGDIYLFATKDIGGSKGGFKGEEIVIDYRQSVRAAFKALEMSGG